MRSRTLILGYHRVASPDRDPQELSVTENHFSAQLDVLAQITDVVPLSAVHEPSEGSRSVITFDDGYADNWQLAGPLLESKQLPATFFVTSGMIGRNEEFWWDRLEHLLLGASLPVERLHIDILGKPLEIDVRMAEARSRAYRVLYSRLRPLPVANIRAILHSLSQTLGASQEARESHRPLGPDELKHLANIPHIQIGAHSHSHPLLAAQPKRAQHGDLKESKVSLEAHLGRPIVHFSYPFGGRDAVSRTTVRLVRRLGFDDAVANYEGLVGRAASRWLLPRFLVRDWSAETFRIHLNRWLGGN